MGLSQVTFNVGRDGLGRRTPNEDKVSGIIFFNDTPPSGWSSTNVQLVYTLDEAEQKGLTEAAVGHEDEWYHVSEYFRLNPEGELYIGYFDVPAGAYDYTELETLQIAASGRIRQVGIYSKQTFASANVTTLQGVIDDVDDTGGRLVAILCEDMSGVADWSAVDDLRALSAPKVSVVAGQDGGAAGLALYTSKGNSITALGAALGALSRASVEESIGWVSQFNVSDGTELEIPALANGDLVSATSSAILGALKDKGYLVLRKYTPQITGTYFERQPAAVASTDDFAWIEYSRVMDKAIRFAETALTPELNRPLVLDSDGKLTKDTVGYFEDLVQAKLDEMGAEDEISASEVDVDPDQDVLGTSTLVLTIRIVPVGIAEFITVNIGFTVEL
jgi:hypothetical protein